MPTDLFRSILKRVASEVSGIHRCTISGFGEFSMDPDWVHKLEIARRYFNESLHVITNLAGVHDSRQIAALSRLATEIRISINATTPEVFCRVHCTENSAAFAHQEYVIRELARLKPAGHLLRLSFVAVKENIHQYKEWITRWQHVVDEIEVWQPHNWVDGRSYRAPSPRRLHTCGRPFHGPLQVQVDGTMNVCCFDYNGELLIGDLRVSSFDEILSGEKMSHIRSHHRDGNADRLAPCRLCDQRDLPAERQKYLLYCNWESTAERVMLTSSAKEKIPV